MPACAARAALLVRGSVFSLQFSRLKQAGWPLHRKNNCKVFRAAFSSFVAAQIAGRAAAGLQTPLSGAPGPSHCLHIPMATAAVVSQPKITICPPGPERPELHFDIRRRIHIDPKFPVSAKFVADGEVETPGIAFEDYRTMSTQEFKLEPSRRLEAPEWALNDALLRKVLVRFIEARAGFNYSRSGTEQERLQLAMQKIAAQRPARIAVLKGLCAKYVALKQRGYYPEYLRKLAQEIESWDTVLRFDSNIAAIVIGVVHAYYRRGLDSVDVAEEFNMKPPHVRMILWRLRRCWERINNPVERPKRRGGKGRRKLKVNARRVANMYAAGASIVEIAKKLKVSPTTIFQALKRSRCYRPRRGRRTQAVLQAVHNSKGHPRTIAKHVAIMEKLCANNGGLLPPYVWLNANGYFTSYQIMRKNLDAFAHIQRQRMH